MPWLRLTIPNDFGFLPHPSACHAVGPGARSVPRRVALPLARLDLLVQFERYVPDVELHPARDKAGDADL